SPMKFLPRAIAALFVASLTLALVQSAATAQEAALTPAQIHAQLSPAIPQIETPLGSGSGILIDSRHVVTASHVIWPYDRANVRFADEQVFRDVRVVGFDLIADLAVLEFDSPLPFQPVTIADSSAAALGLVVYLMGYSNPVD